MAITKMIPAKRNPARSFSPIAAASASVADSATGPPSAADFAASLGSTNQALTAQPVNVMTTVLTIMNHQLQAGLTT